MQDTSRRYAYYKDKYLAIRRKLIQVAVNIIMLISTKYSNLHLEGTKYTTMI